MGIRGFDKAEPTEEEVALVRHNASLIRGVILRKKRQVAALNCEIESLVRDSFDYNCLRQKTIDIAGADSMDNG